MTLRQTLEQQWQEGGALATALRPLGALTGAVAQWRRRHIQGRVASIPTVVVGNLGVGGSGKTPLVAALARQLSAAGWRVAIISRGYGARPPHWPYRVPHDDSPRQAGDEPLLLAQEQRQTQAVYLCPDRHRAIAAAAVDGYNLALLDDGFQHLALQPSLRLLVLSGLRPLGNGHCLPAGPLRECPDAMLHADALLMDAAAAAAIPERNGLPRFLFRIQPKDLVAVNDPSRSRSLDSLQGQRVTAVTGIARPQRFVASLEGLGALPDPRFFPDHHPFCAADLAHLPRPLVMTAKDAVKCREFAQSDDWALRIEAELEPSFQPWLERSLLPWRS
ncbi:Putative tetraacyldisaccharide 4'-kinase LpxK [Acidithiobacillus ferrivorans]|uniref:Tetraacyldisaccharide 4'-kinase n=1 Tax=Acidithiobacillus ferrivorans TaxID=160808 RepID=A0A060UM81_9PROT|nr:tetraacyldisaccharide 4'-kinase [Acidithiobacillus ferrivorans]CDQ09431.1 Tetraacyldisaccharide 4'-kinase [Acidithiobacillus ferrivorans]SMH67320.1 Putative tetraacyldisaccharide 4'-kinase LpxK [Acidithiobacillus ferrivorans]